MALHKKGIEAKSFTGSQAGIITCNNHTEAHICHVKPHRVIQALQDSQVVIIAGFQGVSEEERLLH